MDENWRDKLPGHGVSQESLPISGAVVEDGKVLVPAMDEEEVARSIASKGKKMVPVEIPDFCTPWQFKVTIAATFAYYMRAGVLPTPQDVQDDLSDIGAARVQRIMEHPLFRRAMYIRGIDYNVGRRLTPEQDMAIAIMGTPDGRPFEKKLKAAGIAPSRWRAWLKQKTFRDAWEHYGGSVLKDHETDMLVALTGQALNGDVSAIKYAFEVSGKHDPARRNNIDAGKIIMTLLEIVQQEVKDASTLNRIAARMQMVGQVTDLKSIVEDAIEDGAQRQLEG